MDISFKGIEDARDRIEDYIVRTPLLRIEALDDILNCKFYLKPENLQKTGSFKLRGATNSLLTLSPSQKASGVVASSSGNHAQGLAAAAKILDIDAKIVMPENCNRVKLENVKSFGADVELVGTSSSERDARVRELVDLENRVEIHPYANPYVKEGQGTIGLEILEDQEDIDVIICPIGGGGLISGVSLAAKTINENIKIIGVEPESARRYARSIEENKIVKIDKIDTIADGTRTDKADRSNLDIIKENVDCLLSVSDREIKEAMKLVAEKAKLIVEPSSAMVVAALMSDKLKVKRDDKVCVVISGGNNDMKLLSEIIG